MQDKSFK